MRDIPGYLKENGIKPSLQRIRIFEYLITKKNHPTVDMIYKELVKAIPTLSKTTVYNTLNIFIQQKIVLIIVIEENEIRYDTNLKKHGHFKCEKCGDIHNVEIDIDVFEIKSLESFQIDEQHLYYKGVCNKCL